MANKLPSHRKKLRRAARLRQGLPKLPAMGREAKIHSLPTPALAPAQAALAIRLPPEPNLDANPAFRATLQSALAAREFLSHSPHAAANPPAASLPSVIAPWKAVRTGNPVQTNPNLPRRRDLFRETLRRSRRFPPSDPQSAQFPVCRTLRRIPLLFVCEG